VEEIHLSDARIRPARTEEDLERAAEFLGTPRVREIVDGHPEERGAVRICELGDRIIGGILLDPTPMRVRGVEVRCARVCETGGEDGRQRFRETGRRDLFAHLIEETLGYVWVKRYPLAFVHGELSLYPEHGFVPCFWHPRTYVSTDQALALAAPYRVRRFKADDVAGITELRNRHRRWKPIVFSAGVPPFHHFTILDGERRVRGCFSLVARPEARSTPKLFAPEVEVDDRAAACTFLRHCAEKARELELPQMHFPLGPGHPVARLCLELGGRAVLKGAATDPFLDEEMLFMVDPPRLVAALRPWFERRLAGQGREITASVPLVTEGGAWVLRVAEGTVALAPVDPVPEGALEIPRWMLTQLLAGYRAVRELDRDLTPEQEDVLSLLFTKTWPYSLPDADHFDDIPPRRPWSDVAAEAVRKTVLPWAP